MGGAMDFEPHRRVGLVFAKLRANLRREDLGAAAGKAAETRRDQFFKHAADREFGNPREPFDLDGGVGLEVDFGVRFLDDAKEPTVPVEILEVMESADDVHFGDAAGVGFVGPLADFRVAHHVGFRRLEVGAKRTEVATVDADVRRVQVDVDVVIAAVAMLAFTDEISEFGEREEVVAAEEL